MIAEKQFLLLRAPPGGLKYDCATGPIQGEKSVVLFNIQTQKINRSLMVISPRCVVFKENNDRALAPRIPQHCCFTT